MFYHFILPLQEHLSFLRLFQYISFRSIYAALTALLFVLFFGKPMITFLQNLKFKEEIRELGPQSHKVKSGTPTMGGLIIISAILVSIALWGNFTSIYLLVLIAATIMLGALGFMDDYIKAVKKVKDGMSARMKFILQISISLFAAIVVFLFPSNAEHVTDLYVPFMNEPILELSVFWIILAVLVITGTSNAVNLTDGLDGLAVGSVLIVTVTLGIMSYVTGHVKIAEYLGIPYIPDAAEITVFLAAMTGACLGFLWYNSNPAAVFMGDTGSLTLGGIIGIVAVMLKKEIFLFFVGGIFVIEVLSVILQVGSFKLRGKRIFKMSPIHHHFELSGWPEQKVVVRMWIIGMILSVIGLSTLKIL